MGIKEKEGRKRVRKEEGREEGRKDDRCEKDFARPNDDAAP